MHTLRLQMRLAEVPPSILGAHQSAPAAVHGVEHLLLARGLLQLRRPGRLADELENIARVLVRHLIPVRRGLIVLGTGGRHQHLPLPLVRVTVVPVHPIVPSEPPVVEPEAIHQLVPGGLGGRKHLALLDPTGCGAGRHLDHPPGPQHPSSGPEELGHHVRVPPVHQVVLVLHAPNSASMGEVPENQLEAPVQEDLMQTGGVDVVADDVAVGTGLLDGSDDLRQVGVSGGHDLLAVVGGGHDGVAVGQVLLHEEQGELLGEAEVAVSNDEHVLPEEQGGVLVVAQGLELGLVVGFLLQALELGQLLLQPRPLLQHARPVGLAAAGHRELLLVRALGHLIALQLHPPLVLHRGLLVTLALGERALQGLLLLGPGHHGMVVVLRVRLGLLQQLVVLQLLALQGGEAPEQLLLR
mmetsp:Transcript_34112/g.74531  ORF Transcript_34112/g.74531 Transcript_34112/m.74531 type:complete len:411 (-) Transcript_34112:12-1244(-)